uniref:Uncharacterized protein n=1 Tax=Tanacetum cinerariifolium TaxID=118510 RepID=A0A6L2JIN2_TANCI|nr:hypothetical protein [Tanacetum cinerariifolium]
MNKKREGRKGRRKERKRKDGELHNIMCYTQMSNQPFSMVENEYLYYIANTWTPRIVTWVVISTTLARKNDEFLKSSVDDFVPILRESKVTSVYNDLECSIPFDSPAWPCTDVLGDEKVDINLAFGEQVDTLLMGDMENYLNSLRDVGNLGSSLAGDHILIPRMFDEPLGNSDSMSISFETSDFLLEELTAEIGLDDSIQTKIEVGYYDSKGDILYLEQFFNEDTSSDLSLELFPKDSSLLVLPLPDSKQICLREVERFDPFFSLTQSGDMTRMMERHFDRFPRIPLPDRWHTHLTW